MSLSSPCPPLEYFLLPNLYLHISKKSTAIELPFFCTTAQHLLLHLWVHVRLWAFLHIESGVFFFLFFFIIFIRNVSLFLAEMLACRSKLCLNQGSSRVSLTWLRQKQSEHVLRAHRTGAPVLAVKVVEQYSVLAWNVHFQNVWKLKFSRSPVFSWRSEAAHRETRYLSPPVTLTPVQTVYIHSACWVFSELHEIYV